MGEKDVKVYIVDLPVSDRAKSVLTRMGYQTLNEVLRIGKTDFSDVAGVDIGTAEEINGVIREADNIFSEYTQRQEKIRAVSEEMCTKPVEELEMSAHTRRILRRAGIDTIGQLIHMSGRNIWELRGAGAGTRNEIRAVIDHMIGEDRDGLASPATELASGEPNESAGSESSTERTEEIQTGTDKPSVPIEELHLSVRAVNALKHGGVSTLDELKRMSEDEIARLRNIGVRTTEEIISFLQSTSPEENSHGEPGAANDQKKAPIDMPRRLGDGLAVGDEFRELPICSLPLSKRAVNALTRGGAATLGSLLEMTETDVRALRNIGENTVREIVAFIQKLDTWDPDHPQVPETKDEEPVSRGRGFDYSVIDTLSERFFFKPVRMTEWFGLSRQAIYNVLEKRNPQRRDKWTGKELTDREAQILEELILEKRMEYRDDTVICLCLNDRINDFACLFVQDTEIKCFFLKDLSESLRQKIIESNFHRFTEKELTGAAEGSVVYILKKPHFVPTNAELFRSCAAARDMTLDDYAQFIAGAPYAEARMTTDHQIVGFLKESMYDGPEKPVAPLICFQKRTFRKESCGFLRI